MKEEATTEEQLIRELTRLENAEAARLAVEATLLESEARFRNLMDYIPGISIQGYRPDGTVVYWNKASEKVYGYPSREALGKDLGKLIIPPDLRPLFRKSLQEATKIKISGEFMPPGEFMLLHKKGHLVPVYSIHTAVCSEDREPLLFCIDVDLSERRRTEEELRESAAKIRSIFQTAPIGIGVISNGVILEINDRFCEITGYSRNELIGESKRMVYPSDEDYEYVSSEKSRQIKKGGVGTVETSLKRKDGTIIDVLLNSTPLDTADLSAGIMFTALDITERKQAEEKFQSLFELSPVGIFLLTLQGDIKAVNSQGCKIYGFNREELLKLNVREIISPRLAGNFPRLVEDLKKKKHISAESEGKRKNNDIFPLELSFNLFQWRDDDFVQVLVQDISNRKAAENAERLGRLSEMLLSYQEEERKHIARELHDHIGQDLVAIKISLQMLEKEYPVMEAGLRDEIRETVKVAEKAISDVRRISATLRPESLDQMGLVPALEHEIEYLSGRGGIELSFESENFPVRLTSDKEIAIFRIVQEGITNILKHSQADKARVWLSRKGKRLSLSIKDDGVGFSPGWKKSSPGLGLVGIGERVKGLEGKLKITSRKGKGAELLITIPMRE